MIFTFFSCTYDYFEDENNFRLYVPQIKDGTISNFYVAFHDAATGKHVYTRKLEAPFGTDDFTKDGILRFKLRGGDYHISCFADYTMSSLTEGNPLDDSYQTKFACDKSNWLYNYGDNVYASRTTDPRMLLTTATVFPMGYAGGKDPVLIDMDESMRFKGRVDIQFINLPTSMGIARADVIYKGLATKVHFDGVFNRVCDEDRILATYTNIAQYTSGSTITLPTDVINASVGSYWDLTPTDRVTRASTRAPLAEQPLELEIRFFDITGSEVGSISFTKEQFATMIDKPKDANGDPVTSLVLRPKSTIKFVFKDFSIFKIELVGWGSIDEGKVTPM